MGGTAWVTLATNDSYALGALVVANSLKRVNTVHDLAILITPGVTLAMKNELLKVFSFVKEVDVFDSRDETNLRLLSRPDLGITFTKIHAWRLTQYSKCVFLDADVLIVQNCDELFDREEFSAAPDAGWPDCFNSGVFVFKPSDSTYNSLVEFALVNGSFDGGDQGLLNLYFKDWATADSSKRLPFVYNMCSTSTYSYLPALKQFGSQVKIIHFIGSSKPWLQHFDPATRSVLSGDSHLSNFLQLWWDVFVVHVHPTLSTEMAGLARALAQVPIGTPISAEQLAYEDHIHRQHWEEGHIDYLGKDSWDNIWKKISQTIEPAKPASAEPPTSSVDTQTADGKVSSATVPEVKPVAVDVAPTVVSSTPTTPPVVPSEPTAAAPIPTPAPPATPVPTPASPATPVPTPAAPVAPIETPTTPAAPVETPATPAPSSPAVIPAPVAAEAPKATEAATVPAPAVELPASTKATPTEAPTAVPVATPTAPAATPSETPTESSVLPSSTPTVPTTPPVETAVILPPTPAASPSSPESPASEVTAATPTPVATPVLPPVTPVAATPAEASPTSAVSAAIASAVTMAAAPAVSPTTQVTPATPTVTSPTPPQSPLSDVASKMEKLAIDPSISEAQAASSEPPIPPKRKGSKDGQAGKGGKGKK